VTKKNSAISDEELTKAADELVQAIADSLPNPGDCKHEFSEQFAQKMQKLHDNIDSVTGDVT